MLSGSIQKAPAGVRGFDANTPISSQAAQDFFSAGFRFCLRYVGRTQMASHDLSAQEAEGILAAGLALMPVQHVEEPGWHPTGDLGAEYGRNAATVAQQIGFPAGVNVWCDLESVSTHAAAQDVIAYCNAWSDAVTAAGFAPGLYVGYGPGLTGQQLHDDLRFDSYWAAYNVDGVSTPRPRGWQLIQSEGHGTIAGISTEDYDADTTQTDSRGGQVAWLQR
jgi:hypothetical protein